MKNVLMHETKGEKPNTRFYKESGLPYAVFQSAAPEINNLRKSFYGSCGSEIVQHTITTRGSQLLIGSEFKKSVIELAKNRAQK